MSEAPNGNGRHWRDRDKWIMGVLFAVVLGLVGVVYQTTSRHVEFLAERVTAHDAMLAAQRERLAVIETQIKAQR